MYFKQNKDGTGGTFSTEPSLRDLKKEVEMLRATVKSREAHLAKYRTFMDFVSTHDPKLIKAWRVLNEIE